MQRLKNRSYSVVTPVNKSATQRLRSVGDRAGTRDTGDGDRDALRVTSGIGLAGHRVHGLHVVGSANQRNRGSRGDAILEEKLVSGRRKLARIVEHRFILGGLAHLLERGNGHGGQEADDDHDDHDFNERKT